MADTQALAAVARLLRGAAPGADAEVTAREILAVLRGHGWRPIPAAAVPPASRPLPPEQVHDHAARARRAITGGRT